ncbi:class I SAM-dependent methyltransferase [Planctomicrobium piriforme]|uniref:Ubiquinone/menaquinone biosynthesis C-methylase UbiE n=1 Tax=Planctomicrobium piriforme TaxID=1576369 RepID=A0A1I3DG15_9PLAN|nr:class I SAM-dependent methyltransferase [Planctomicrobium piriforme]SFH85667.1 Ubiquinone/menaquinone biosynthesis C-methylase UbiE [Planctomicrobium piriforme]
MSYQEANQKAWDQLALANSQFAAVATDAECAQPLLTLDKRGWLPGSVKGLDVLCLAAGGGWQSILYAVAGARVTVVDLSEEMLNRDREQARLRNLDIRILQASMNDLSQLEAASFDIVHQPVSTCYVPKIREVYAQIARVLRQRGIYISQHKQPTSLQVVERDTRNRYVIGVPYYHGDPLPAVRDTAYREPGAVEYLHRWEELVGELCRAGFVIEDLVEPRRGDPKAKPGNFKHRGMFVAPYVRIKARRLNVREEETRSPIWVPE